MLNIFRLIMSNEKKKFPIEDVLDDLVETLNSSSLCILAAPPGAGKTTLAAPALLKSEWLLNKKIIMLEPRRLAARRAAAFMSSERGERCGKTIGYRIRSEAVVTPSTRIEVVTEGILTRMLQNDNELPEVGLIIFDEFHERSIHADTSLAFALDVQENLRPDLKILIMSATLDISKLLMLIKDAPVIESKGSMFPVQTIYKNFSPGNHIEKRVTEAVLYSMRNDDPGDILVFLPGRREIQRTGELLYDKLKDADVIIHELFGDAPGNLQDEALRIDAMGRRKIILATSIAETSLTIEGIKVVIDSGLARMSSFDPKRGMSGLITVPVSKATADQRRGRAGRQAPGICYRLWSEAEHENLPAHPTPEILSADLTSLALELATWGNPDAKGMSFSDPPPAANLSQAQSVLQMLGALDNNKHLTAHGRAMSQLPLHPRLSSMVIKSKTLLFDALACKLAALLEERDLPGARSTISLADRWHLLHSFSNKTKSSALKIFEQAKRLQELIKSKDNDEIDEDRALGLLLAMTYPERIAQRKNENQYLLVQGTMASLNEGDLLLRNEYLAVGDVDNRTGVVRIFLAAPILKEDILRYFDPLLNKSREVKWTNGSLRGRELTKLGALELLARPIQLGQEEISEGLLMMIRSEGLSVLPWTKESISLRQRSQWIREYILEPQADWPSTDDMYLLGNLNSWLAPFITDVKSLDDIKGLRMYDIVLSMHTYEQQKKLEAWAPEFLNLPSGSRIRLRYDEGEQPALAVRLQELFGQTDTPKVGGGKINVLIHLLSPANRPLSITQDLRSFWTNTYPEILKQMRMKYPKHVWPDDPFSAKPTNKTKRWSI